MTWARSYTEQDLQITKLEKAVATIQHQQDTVVIHSFMEPRQRDWEAEYYNTYGYPAPIPVGVTLLWHDLKNNINVQYQTAYDLDNGRKSSGVVRLCTRDQFESAIRFIGNVNFNGTLATAENNHPLITIGSNLEKWRADGLVMLEVWMQIKMDAANPLYLSLDWGDDRTNADAEGSGADTDFHLQGQLATGVVSVAGLLHTGAPRELYAAHIPTGPIAGSGATANPAHVVWLRIFTPFNDILKPDGSPVKYQQNTVITGRVYGPRQTYAPTFTGLDATAYVAFSLQRIRLSSLGRDWRIYMGTNSTHPPTYPIAKAHIREQSRGWVYGYFNRSTRRNRREVEFDAGI